MRNMPPGRTARVWLHRRLRIALRGVEVLEQKTYALTREQRRLRHHVDDTRHTWEQASHDADRWLQRAVVLGGRHQFQLARSQVSAPADAQIRWRSVMGVTYPADAYLAAPETHLVEGTGRSSALVFTADAHRQALEAGLDYASARRALELLEDELAVTRQRLRALENRWIPRLRETLHEVELALTEDEREDMVRAAWVAERGSATHR